MIGTPDRRQPALRGVPKGAFQNQQDDVRLKPDTPYYFSNTRIR